MFYSNTYNTHNADSYILDFTDVFLDYTFR